MLYYVRPKRRLRVNYSPESRNRGAATSLGRCNGVLARFLGAAYMKQSEWLSQLETVLEVLNEGVRHRRRSPAHTFCKLPFRRNDRDRPAGPGRIRTFAFLYFARMGFSQAANRSCLPHRPPPVRFRLPRKDGGRLPVIISSRTLENFGTRLGIVTFTDISEQVRAEDELRAANAKLQRRQKEIEEDLRLAARVQHSLVPKSVLWDTLTVGAFFHPVHSIGGDFALVNSANRDHLSLLVCDVSGHGIGSALVANRVYSETTAHLRSGMPFPVMFGELNRFLIEDIRGSGMFVTAAAARSMPGPTA